MLYVGDGWVIEAILSGVVRRTLDAALSEATLAVAYRARFITQYHAQLVVAHANRLQAGSRGYDFMGAIGAGLARSRWVCVVLLGELGCGALRHGGPVNPDRFYCSEFVLAAFEAAGVPITTGRRGRSTADDIVNAYSSGRLEYLGHLRL